MGVNHHLYDPEKHFIISNAPCTTNCLAPVVKVMHETFGAAKGVALVLPEMQGRFEGYSVHVPTPTVSMVDFVAVLEKETDAESLKAAAEGELQGILGYSTEPLVSSDYVGDFTTVQCGNLAKTLAWYDNEWAYSCRVADLARYMTGKGI